ncbi:MAG: porin [Pseudomonadota bacterium]
MQHVNRGYKACGLTALSLALAVAASNAQAQSAVQFYGLVNLGVSSQQLSGQARVLALANGDMTTSYYGIRGSEDLGDGLKASFSAEGFFRADTGEVGRGNSDTLFQRQAWVGLSKDGIGTLRLGRLPTPNWLTSIKFGPFGGASITPYVMQTYLPSALQPMLTGSGMSDASWANSIGYSSPVFGGFSALAVVALSEGGVNGKRFGASVNYDQGPLAASLSYEKLSRMSLPFGAPVPPLATPARPSFLATGDRTAQLAASYDFTIAKLFGQHSQTRLTDLAAREIELTTSQLGVSVPLGLGKFMLSWAHTGKKQSAAADLARTTFTIGYDYSLSRRTDAYIAYLHDKVTNLNTGNTYTVGLRHSF